jgi:hypothetical protein
VPRLLLALLLIPSAWFAWTWRHMPRAGEYHDDGIYYVTAQSLATTGEYRIASLPDQPKQTKYPPLWPAILSLAWFAGGYPANLPLIALLCWLCVPATLLLFHAFLRREGFAPWPALAICALWALNPYVRLFGSTMLTELPFLALVLAAILLLRDATPQRALFAGAVAALAFLTRTAGIALLPAAIAWLLFRRERRQAIWFTAAMLPAILGWAAWSIANRNPAPDWLALYYTNYLGFHLRNFIWSETHLFLWKNLDGIFLGLGSYLLPNVGLSLPEKILSQTLAIAGIVGLTRLLRRDPRSLTGLYTAFAILATLMLAAWHFPPNERFMLPVAPLWLAGLWTELAHLAAGIRSALGHRDRSQRIVAAGFGAFAAALLLVCGWKMAGTSFTLMPAAYALDEQRLRATQPMMDWMRAHLPPTARILSEKDPTLFLRTGLRGAGRFPPTIYWYREQFEPLAQLHIGLPAFAREHGFTHIYLNDWDYSRDFPPETHEDIIAGLHRHPQLELLHQSGQSRLYRVLQ